jgi:hypothetical protein
MSGFIAAGLFSFILLLYVPTYNKLGWHYPFGWDTPQYLMWSRKILEDGYLNVVFRNKYPFGTSLLIAFISILLQNDLIKAGILYPIFCLAVYQASLAFLYYKAFRSPFFAGVLALILPFFGSTLELISHLYQQLLYTALLPLLFYFVAEYIEKERTSTLGYLLLMVMVEWFVWPWGTYLTSLLLLTTPLTAVTFTLDKCLVRIRIKRAIKVCFSVGILSLLLYIYWQLFIFGSTLTGLFEISQTRPPYTVQRFIDTTLRGNYILLLLFFTGLALSMKEFLQTPPNNTSKQHIISKLITIFSLALLMILIFTPEYLIEIRYRLDKMILSHWFIIVGLHSISSHASQIVSRRFEKIRIRAEFRNYYRIFSIDRKLIKIMISVVLTICILTQMCPTNTPFIWRRWLPVDDKKLVEALSSAKGELANISQQRVKTILIIPSDNCLTYGSYFLVRLYILSFFPNSFILCNLSNTVNKELLLNNSTSTLYDLLQNNVGSKKVFLLILPELFNKTENMPDQCRSSLKEKGYCLVPLF